MPPFSLYVDSEFFIELEIKALFDPISKEPG